MLRSLIQGASRFRVHSATPTRSGPVLEAVHASIPVAMVLPQPLIQHVRTTFILKRRHKVNLIRVDKKPKEKVLKARDFLYELVEDTNTRKKKPLKVILKTSVEGIGSQGEIVEIRPNKARRKLLLPGLAVYASPENIQKYSGLMDDSSKKDQPSSPFALKTVKLLNKLMIMLHMNKDIPWVIEPWHIRVALRKLSVIVPEEALTLPHHPIVGPDPNLQDKEFGVMVKINNKEETMVRCRINHYMPKLLDRPSYDSYWKMPAEPLFPEQATMLRKLTEMDKRVVFSEEEAE